MSVSQTPRLQQFMHFDTRTGAKLICDRASEWLGTQLYRRYFPGVMNARASLVEGLTGFDMRTAGARLLE